MTLKLSDSFCISTGIIFFGFSYFYFLVAATDSSLVMYLVGVFCVIMAGVLLGRGLSKKTAVSSE